MKAVIVIIGLILLGWSAILMYEVFEKVGDLIGMSREKMHTLFWLSCVLTILTALLPKDK